MRKRNIFWWLYQPYKYLVMVPVVAVMTVVEATVAVALSLVVF